MHTVCFSLPSIAGMKYCDWKQLPKQGFWLAYHWKERIQNGGESMAWQQEQEASWRSMREMDRERERWGGGRGRYRTLEMVRSYKRLKPDPSPIRLHCLSMVKNLPKQGHQWGTKRSNTWVCVGGALLIQTITLCVLRECERRERECGHLKGNRPQSEWHY